MIEATAAVKLAQGDVDTASAAVDEAQDFYTAAAQDYKNLSDAYEASKTENGNGATSSGNTETGTEGGNANGTGGARTDQAAGANGKQAQGEQAQAAAASDQKALPQTGDSTALEVSVISGMGAAAIAAAGIARRRGLHAAL